MSTGLAASYRARVKRIEPDQAPAFDGDTGWAEVQKAPASRGRFYRFARFVDPPKF